MNLTASHRLLILLALLALHGAVTAVAMLDVGFIGIFEAGLANWGARQVFSDLTVSLVLVNGWMIVDARKRGGNAWPFVIASLGLGSLAPLGYLLLRELRDRATVTTSAPSALPRTA